MRFLNPFNRSTNKRTTAKTAGRGGSKRKVKKTTRRRSKAGINWRMVRRAVPAGAALAAVGGLGGFRRGHLLFEGDCEVDLRLAEHARETKCDNTRDDADQHAAQEK